MINNLIASDVELMRKRYDEALHLLGIPCKYQFPNIASSNDQGEPCIDSYSDFIPTYIILDGSPKLKTFQRYGWVVENDKNLPFLIHCSFNLPRLCKDSLFSFSGQYTNMEDRVFRVTELTTDLQAPDHVVCQVVPVYDSKTVGDTRVEVARKFNSSNYFLQPKDDYRGHYYETSKKGK